MNFEADAESDRASASGAADQLSRVSALADALTEAQRDVMAAERDLRGAEEELTRISRDAFPELLREVGLDAVTLADSRGIKLVDDFACGVSEERRSEAYAWLRERGFGGLIKTTLKMEFARGEEALAADIAEVVRSYCATRAELQGRAPEIGEGVHFQTLKSFIAERHAAGEPVPADLFGVHPFAEVKVVYPRGFPGAVKFTRDYKKK